MKPHRLAKVYVIGLGESLQKMIASALSEATIMVPPECDWARICDDTMAVCIVSAQDPVGLHFLNTMAQRGGRPHGAALLVVLDDLTRADNLGCDFSAWSIFDFILPTTGKIVLRKRIQNICDLADITLKTQVLFNYMDEGFCRIQVIFDDDGKAIDYRFIDVNEAFAKQTGMIDAAGRTMRSFAADHEQYWFDAYGEVARTGIPKRFINEAKQLGRWYEIYAYRLGDSKDSQVAIFFNDISERQRIEAAINQAQEDLFEANRKLEEANRQLEARVEERTADLNQAVAMALNASELKSQFIGNISHEMRTPMNSILNLSELLEVESEGETQEFAALINSSAKNLMVIMNDLLDMSKLEAGTLILVEESFSPKEMVDGIMARLRPDADEKGLSLNVSISDDASEEMVGDAMRIGQVLFNLVQNAIKFTTAGSVDVRCTVERLATLASVKQSRYLKFEVTDTGCGIAADKQANLFEPFVQADGTNTRKHGGTGVGLTLCKWLVEMMRGEIGFESEISRGSHFWFVVPFADVTSQGQDQRYD